MPKSNSISNTIPSIPKTLVGGFIPHEALTYLDRVVADSGTVDVTNDELYDIVRFYRDEGLLADTQLLAAPFLGSKVRTSTIYKYLSKLYSVQLAANDLTQTTELSQPYQSGNIAPNEVLAAKNPNGDARFLTHPAISFAANQAWSVSWVINWNYDLCGFLHHNGIDLNNRIYLRTGGLSQYLGFNNSVGGAYTFNLVSHLYFIGKNRMLTMVSDGAGSVKVYIDSVLIQEVTGVTASISFVSLLRGVACNYAGTSHYYRIQSGAMTAGQITAEYNLLRSWIPEIESVQIGSQVWATSNLDVVATPLGNVIPEVQTAGAVEKITNAADREFSSDTGFWTKTGDTLIDSGVCTFTGLGALNYSSSYWCLKKNRAVNTNKYFRITVDVKLISGAGDFYIGFGYQYFIINVTSSSQTYTLTVKSSIYDDISVGGATGSVFEIDNISYQELNWSNATEIYDAVYAATSGTAAEKHYAALKEAAMWCYHGNSTALGSIYNKIYNGYSKGLQLLDLATATYGYHIATKAELQALGSSANALKAIGNVYWTTANGTNTTGKTLLGGAYRDDSTGAFGTIKETVEIWCADVDEVMRIEDESDTITFAAVPKTRGAYIVYVKN